MSTDKDSRIAELERKLAEQQALLKRVCVIYRADGEVLTLSGLEELNNLLAKAKEDGRRDAVPEGWQVVPKDIQDFILFREWVADMLAAAPKPSLTMRQPK